MIQGQILRFGRGLMKMKNFKSAAVASLILTVLLLSFLVEPLFSQSKKLEVTADTANIYLEADDKSPVVAVVNKGTILTLRSTRKVKRIWYHVYVASEGPGVTKSGYIQDSFVERLFVVTKIETLHVPEGMEPHFRKARWHASQEQVIRLEGNPVAKDKFGELDVMRFKDSVQSMDCWIDYFFKDNKLVKGRYIFLVRHDYKTQYFGDYKKAKDFLIEAHEKSPLTNINWLNDEYKDDYSKWGLAVSLGHLEYNAIWNMDETEIMLRLFGENNEVKLVADYTAKLKEKKKKKSGREIAPI